MDEEAGEEKPTKKEVLLWAADPHQFGSGKVHVIDPEHNDKTVCGRYLSAVPGERRTEGSATCLNCLNTGVAREHRKREAAEWAKRAAAQGLAMAAAYPDARVTWWNDYDAYVQKDVWRAKTSAVIKRSGGACEACRKMNATAAIHRSYQHAFHEPLFDLVAVCQPCRVRILALDRANLHVPPS